MGAVHVHGPTGEHGAAPCAPSAHLSAHQVGGHGAYLRPHVL